MVRERSELRWFALLTIGRAPMARPAMATTSHPLRLGSFRCHELRAKLPPQCSSWRGGRLCRCIRSRRYRRYVRAQCMRTYKHMVCLHDYECGMLQHLLCSRCRLFSGARSIAFSSGRARRKSPWPAFTFATLLATRSEPFDTGMSLRLGPPRCRTHGVGRQAAHVVRACGNRG